MKKSFSIVYTVCVSVLLLGVMLYLGWGLYQIRAGVIAGLGLKTDSWTRQLETALSVNRDIDSEIDVARDLMRSDMGITAVQVYSEIDGLRLSVVKPPAEEFSREPIVESDMFDGFFYRILFRVTRVPMLIDNGTGLEAVFVNRIIPEPKLHNSLLIILVTLLALFIITLVLIIIQRGSLRGREESDAYGGGYGSGQGDGPSGSDFDDFSGSWDSENDLPEFRDDSDDEASDAFDPVDAGRGNTAGTLDSDDFPEFADDEFGGGVFQQDGAVSMDSGLTRPLTGEMMERLEDELDEATANNRDLSLVLYSPREMSLDQLLGVHDNRDLIFSLGDDGFAVIETGKDLDSVLAETENFVRHRIESRGNRLTRVGIASRNGRLVSAEHLVGEAQSALTRTDAQQNIVAFRSDPNKYREYLSGMQPG